MLVHPASKIDAINWVSKINQCDDVPSYFKQQITRVDSFIDVPDPFSFPTDVIEKDWLGDWLSGFDGWVVTTGLLEIKVTNGGAQGPQLEGDVTPDLSDGETIDGFAKWAGLHIKSQSLDTFGFEYGDTLGSEGVSLKSGLKLIVIVDRVTLRYDKTVKQYVIDDSEIVGNWFHEIACHAGRESQGKPSWHGDVTVDSYALDIETMFTRHVTTPKIVADVRSFFLPQKAGAKP